MKVICFRIYAGLETTGGQLVSKVFCDALSEICEVEIRTFPIYNEPSFLKKLRYLVEMRRAAHDALGKGYHIYDLGKAGTIEYVQPPIIYKSGMLAVLERLKERLALLYLTGFSDNRRICIFASDYVRRTYEKYTCKGPVIYPPLLEKIGFNFSDKEDLILMISRISKEKNIEMIGELSNRIDSKFVVVGFVTDKNRKYLEKLKKRFPNLTITPNASSDEKMRYLGKAKILLHTAINEPYGMTKIEGMAAGCVPLVHNSGGNPENVPSGCTFKDLDEAEQKIIKILRDYNIETAMKMSNFVSKMDVNNFKQQIRQYLQEVL